MKRYQVLAITILVLGLLCSTQLGVPIARAGTAGQQIYFTTEPTAIGTQDCPSGTLQSVSIVGTNQNGGTPVSWSQASADGYEVTTTNYWWENNVTITYQINGSWFSKVVYIPAQADPGQKDSDTAYVNCEGNRIQAFDQYKYDGYLWTCVTLPDPETGGNPTGHYTATVTVTGYKYIGKDGVMSSSPSLFGDPNGHGYILQITEVMQKIDDPVCDL